MSSPGHFRDIQNRLKKFVESGQLGPFMNGYWGSKAYVLPAEANLMAVTHYLEALDLQKDWVKVHTVIGGKNPHPNFMVGGMPCAINLDRDGAAGAPINMDRLNFIKSRIDEMNTFVKNVYLPEVLDDYGGSLRPAICTALEDALALALHKLREWGAQPRPRTTPVSDFEAVTFAQLELTRYEAERPAADVACRVGDERFFPAPPAH